MTFPSSDSAWKAQYHSCTCRCHFLLRIFIVHSSALVTSGSPCHLLVDLFAQQLMRLEYRRSGDEVEQIRQGGPKGTKKGIALNPTLNLVDVQNGEHWLEDWEHSSNNCSIEYLDKSALASKNMGDRRTPGSVFCPVSVSGAVFASSAFLLPILRNKHWQLSPLNVHPTGG